MPEHLQSLLGLLVAAVLGVALIRQMRGARQAASASRRRVFGDAETVLDDVWWQEMAEPDYPILHGRFDGLAVQLRPVADTLVTRKLPSLWLMITMPVALDVRATFDFMMRPTSATTFSNYDHLPHVVKAPPGWPMEGILRSDDPAMLVPAELLAPALPLFADPRAKELLVSPNGVRFVVQLAEADRARYGVFRQAAFGEVVMSADYLAQVLGILAPMAAALRLERRAA